MRRVLRAVAGLPQDVTVVFDRRVTIGRAADCDIQIPSPEVSRRHARVEVGSDGRAVLVDLSSASGSFVGGARVERASLSSGDEIAIGNCRLRYEEVDTNVVERRPAPTRGMEVLRQTIRIEQGAATSAGRPPAIRRTSQMPPVVERERVFRDDTSEILVPTPPRLPATALPRAPRAELPTTPGPSRATRPTRDTPMRDAAMASSRSSAALADAPQLGGDLPDGVPTIVVDGPSARGISSPLVLLAPDDPAPQRAPEPASDPLRDRAAAMATVRAMFDYRALRLHQLRHEILDYDELARLDELEQQFGHVDADDGRRRHIRFPCEVPGWLVRIVGDRFATAAIALEDISAGGAHARITDAPRSGEKLWLVVDLEDQSPDPVLVLGVRVAWSLPEDHRIGLAFAGAVRSGVDWLELVRADLV